MKSSISIYELKNLLSEKPVPLFDVRTPSEFATTHIAEAKSIPLDQLELSSIAQLALEKSQPLYLICQSGSRAQKASEKFFEMGHHSVFVIAGGMQAWEKEGFPVEKGSLQILSLDRQLRIVLGTLVLTGVLMAHFVHPIWIWLSGFIGAGLIFAGVTDICLMQRFIAQMPWNQISTSTNPSSCKGGSALKS